MNKKIKTDAVDHLFQAVLCLQTQEECYDFFEDLCTVNELLPLSQRFEVASMLKQHKTYLEIEEKTGASTASTWKRRGMPWLGSSESVRKNFSLSCSGIFRRMSARRSRPFSGKPSAMWRQPSPSPVKTELPGDSIFPQLPL